MHKQISSLQNSLVKQFVLLQEKSRERKKSSLFCIEGLREINLAVESSFKIKTILFCAEIIASEVVIDLEKKILTTEFIEISTEVYNKLAYRNSTEGILAIAEIKDLSIEKLEITSKNPLILIAEAPEKPGNIGAILRTADAANVEAVLIANPKTDMFNPNIIRSSVGGIFTNQIATGTTSEIIDFLKSKNIEIYCAALQASIDYSTCSFTKASAIVVGTEATGLSDLWLKNSSQNIIIAMEGKIDSMNVSVAAGILIFEAKRQRKIK